ncbi:MAG: ribosomal protein S18-alanine N-acetyltransferase [Chloroflexota bacterium]|nr:ribosomal protein S18-alanine N-acetyltransferase [Chloroflexota bacterium]
MSLTLRYMRLADVHTVAAIDALAFSSPWSEQAYQFEVGESNYSHMLVLEEGATAPARPSWIARLLSSIGTAPPRGTIMGYGGLWHMSDEAHISTVAVDEAQRGKGYGELLLAAMCVRGIRLRAGFVILEVRVSNTVAQNLYRKYDFEIVTVKKRYYQADGEDAYAMRLALTPETIAHVESRFAALIVSMSISDDFTLSQPVRRR